MDIRRIASDCSTNLASPPRLRHPGRRRSRRDILFANVGAKDGALHTGSVLPPSDGQCILSTRLGECLSIPERDGLRKHHTRQTTVQRRLEVATAMMFRVSNNVVRLQDRLECVKSLARASIKRFTGNCEYCWACYSRRYSSHCVARNGSTPSSRFACGAIAILPLTPAPHAITTRHHKTQGRLHRGMGGDG